MSSLQDGHMATKVPPWAKQLLQTAKSAKLMCGYYFCARSHGPLSRSSGVGLLAGSSVMVDFNNQRYRKAAQQVLDLGHMPFDLVLPIRTGDLAAEQAHLPVHPQTDGAYVPDVDSRAPGRLKQNLGGTQGDRLG
ncbi:uncharacterized protein PG986_006568 [Apiospora aurea]|uniref:Uncharacterized protein n=1 Tax=Apiospora aurea TaxID=335848 RepID=A0ABR1QKS6_9PEZI